MKLKTLILIISASSLSMACIDIPECKADLSSCKKEYKQKINKVFACIDESKTSEELENCNKEKKEVCENNKEKEK